jgi:FtsZ-interacting cell division protein YlmF
MDVRSLTGRVSERIKAVFSKNNRFFYGTSEQHDNTRQAPVQGEYPQNYAGQPVYQQQAYQQVQQQAYQQPVYQQFAYQQAPYQQPAPYQDYAQQPVPQQWQSPAYHDTDAAYAGQPASPQHAQLQMSQSPEQQPGRNRRVAQHNQNPQSTDNLVQFPGAQQTEPETTRQMDAYVVNITSVTGCRQAMTCLRKGQCTLVVMDQLIDKAEVRRYVDMLSGACFALGGTMTRLSQKVGFYILAPSGMMVYTDPITASANAPARPLQQPVSQGQPSYQQPAYQQMMPPAYSAQQSPYAPPQQVPGYQQQSVTSPYAPPMSAAQPEYQQDAHLNRRYAQ